MSKFSLIARLQHWMDSVPGQTFMNYAYSWGAAVVILGTLFKLTHIPGANLMLFIGMGTEVFVFFISGFDRPFNASQDTELADEFVDLEDLEAMKAAAHAVAEAGGAVAGGTIVAGGTGGGTVIIGGGQAPAGGTVIIGGDQAAGEATEGGTTIIGGGIAGIGGAFYELDKVQGHFQASDGVDAFGWLALCIVIFSLWKPTLAVAASFGFACLSILPSFLAPHLGGMGYMKYILEMVPYVATIIVLIITSIFENKKNQPPANLGISYFREDR